MVVFDKESDEQNQEIIGELASRLSGQFRCPLLAVLNHDDDILWCQLYLSGELVDEYDSAPGYFETGEEEVALAGPEGGDAQKLCAAFESNAFARVKGILRKSAEDEDGYTFAVERHQDLTAALGISSFGVGASFELVSTGELPEDLHSNELISTKNLAAGPPLEDIWRRPIPGYYKVSFRANPGLTRSIPSAWMPGTWAELECSEQDLSEAFRKTTASYRETFRMMGFAELGFKKLKGALNPVHRDDGGVNYLDCSRCQFGQLIYQRFCSKAQEEEKESVIVAFTAVLPNEVVSCTNRTSPSDDVLPNHTVIRVRSDDVTSIHRAFVEELSRRSDVPRRFEDLLALRNWFDSQKLQLFEDKVRRGLWVRMSDYEVEKFRRNHR